MKIYISIPITGKDIKAQKNRVALLWDTLCRRGHTPVSPFDVHAPEHLNEKEQYAYYMGEDVRLLLGCDAILMADPKWSQSKGCSIEHFIADRAGLEIFYSIYDTPPE